MTTPELNEPLTIKYIFKFEDNTQKEFPIRLNRKTLGLITPPPNNPPSWTALTCFQCPHCPLKPATTPHCPIALNIIDLINYFCQSMSIEVLDVDIHTEERNYSKNAMSLQMAISSLIGIYMVTSGCPIMDKLRPMVRFHLPFASMEETTYRAMSMYLIAQFLLSKENKKTDWELKKLNTLYEDINGVNIAFSKRLRELHIEDASLNAIVRLSCFASTINLSLSEDILDDIKELFAAYL